jgi:polysaccharide pyruvyl transferase WcaK-like protein
VALERASAVVARDRQSFDFLKTLAPGARAVLATDVAFALPFEDRSRSAGAWPLRVGINISGLLFTDAERGINRFGLDFNYAELTRRLVSELAKRDDVEINFFAHVAAGDNEGDDDARVIARLANDFPSARIEAAFAGPSEAKSYMSGLDFVVSGRMHACIGSFSAGVPVVPIAYSRKFKGLFGSLGYDWMVPTNGMDTDAALSFILDAFDRRETLKRDGAEAMKSVDGLLGAYRAELATFFQSAVK